MVPPVAVSRFPQLEETSSPSLRSWSKSSHAKVPQRNFQFPSICFAIRFVTNQHTTEVEALLTGQISIIFWRASFPSFDIFWFLDCRFPKSKFENRLLRYRGINNEGVLERPWTIWRVLKAISSTLKFQYFRKSWKVDFLMQCKTRSCHSSREYLRMLRALLPDTPRPLQFQPELPKKQVFVKNSIFQFFPVASFRTAGTVR